MDMVWSDANHTGRLLVLQPLLFWAQGQGSQQGYLKGLESPKHSVGVYCMASAQGQDQYNKVWLCFTGGVPQEQTLR